MYSDRGRGARMGGKRRSTGSDSVVKRRRLGDRMVAEPLEEAKEAEEDRKARRMEPYMEAKVEEKKFKGKRIAPPPPPEDEWRVEKRVEKRKAEERIREERRIEERRVEERKMEEERMEDKRMEEMVITPPPPLMGYWDQLEERLRKEAKSQEEKAEDKAEEGKSKKEKKKEKKEKKKERKEKETKRKKEKSQEKKEKEKDTNQGVDVTRAPNFVDGWNVEEKRAEERRMEGIKLAERRMEDRRVEERKVEDKRAEQRRVRVAPPLEEAFILEEGEVEELSAEQKRVEERRMKLWQERVEGEKIEMKRVEKRKVNGRKVDETQDEYQERKKKVKKRSMRNKEAQPLKNGWVMEQGEVEGRRKEETQDEIEERWVRERKKKQKRLIGQRVAASSEKIGLTLRAPYPVPKLHGGEAQVLEELVKEERVPGSSLLVGPEVQLASLLVAHGSLCEEPCTHGREMMDDGTLEGREVCQSFPTVTYTCDGGMELRFPCPARAATFLRALTAEGLAGEPVPDLVPSCLESVTMPAEGGEEVVLVCCLAMATTSRESVDMGKVAAPLRFSLTLGGREVVTRPVLPLQLLQGYSSQRLTQRQQQVCTTPHIFTSHYHF